MSLPVGLRHRGRQLVSRYRALFGPGVRREKGSVLFIGNSHLSAFKLAYDELPDPVARTRFFCASGADLFFTTVSDDKIKPVQNGRMTSEELLSFYGPSQFVPDRYLRGEGPVSNVAAQLLATGGEAEIDLRDVKAIFYVVGMSPYDFRRLGKDTLTLPDMERLDLLGRILEESFLMRRQILAIRDRFPSCRHYLIGRPFSSSDAGLNSKWCRADVLRARAATRLMANRFLFDDVFMPDAPLLSGSLLATNREFCVGGRQEAQIFQNNEPTKGDYSHMNRSYGHVVFRAFVLPLMGRLRAQLRSEH